MKNWQKVTVSLGAIALIGAGVWTGVARARKGVVTVQTASVTRQDLTQIVTASGEIKPRTYTNVMAEGFGKITDLAVKEGDQVKRGAILLRLENVQPSADVDAQKAGLSSAEAAVRSAEASGTSAEADLAQRKASLEKAKLDWEREQQLLQAGLIPKQDYDAAKSAYDGAVAAVSAGEARLQQARADFERARFSMTQTRAVLAHTSDVLRKTVYQAPIDGTVTYISVRVGENVVPGIQNASGSYLMTISDMSVVTAEVKVDETDIANVRTGQLATVSIDAMPGKVFPGRVAEVGTQAVLRSSGLASTQSTNASQEAKDFKVVITLDTPPAGLRPGLSATGKITTAQKQNIVAIPIQALAVRTRKELDDAAKKASGVTLAASRPAAPNGASNNDEIQGVFVVRDNKAQFVPIDTGISGISDIEVSRGLQEGDIIVTGSYKALRTLRQDAKIKIDNATPRPSTENPS
jgi:HlyD family secretion protein